MHHTVNFKGKPIHLDGPMLKVGDKAPDVTLRKNLLEDTKLSDTRGRVRILSVVPSLDTPVCAIQTRRFNQEATRLPNVQILTISADLPPAQARFCGAEGIDPERIRMLSDHKDVAFGKAYGTLIPDLRVECRALFVVDKDDTIKHVEYVNEVTQEPNYDAALKVARQLAG
jgi:thiol peroxidase